MPTHSSAAPVSHLALAVLWGFSSVAFSLLVAQVLWEPSSSWGSRATVGGGCKTSTWHCSLSVLCCSPALSPLPWGFSLPGPIPCSSQRHFCHHQCPSALPGCCCYQNLRKKCGQAGGRRGPAELRPVMHPCTVPGMGSYWDEPGFDPRLLQHQPSAGAGEEGAKAHSGQGRTIYP